MVQEKHILLEVSINFYFVWGLNESIIRPTHTKVHWVGLLNLVHKLACLLDWMFNHLFFWGLYLIVMSRIIIKKKCQESWDKLRLPVYSSFLADDRISRFGEQQRRHSHEFKINLIWKLRQQATVPSNSGSGNIKIVLYCSSNLLLK